MSFTNPTPMQFEPEHPSTDGTIPLCVPSINGNEWRYIKECLDTNWVSSAGGFVDRFELAIANYLGAKHAVATSNGTAALHLALLASNIQPDEEVIVPALTFVAPANAVRYIGAWPVFIDVDPDYWQLDPTKVKDFVRNECRWQRDALVNKQSGRRVRGILPVHLLGHPVDLDPIMEIARDFDLTVIEDATESLGATYKGQPLGVIGDIACFSFNGNKIITTGGGGMVVTNNEDWARKVKYLSTQAKDDPIEYVHNEIGYNYRMTNIQAAMGCAQLEQLEQKITAKRFIGEFYHDQLKSVGGIELPREAEWAKSIYWLYTILIDHDNYNMDSRTLMELLLEDKIQSRPLWHTIHDLPSYRRCQSYHVEVASRLHRNGLSLPSSVDLAKNTSDLERVINVIRNQGPNPHGGVNR